MGRQKNAPRVVVLGVVVLCGLVTPLSGQDCPEVVGWFPGDFTAVAVSGDYAYLGSGPFFLVVNISDPSAPWGEGVFWLSGYPADVQIRDITVSDGYAYASFFFDQSSNDGGVIVIDVRMPSTPAEVSFLPIGFHSGIAVSNGYAYVGTRSPPGMVAFCVLYAFDVSDPSNPMYVGSYWGVTSEADDLSLSGEYVYVADLVGGLRVMDVSTPWAPIQVGLSGTPDFANAVSVSGDYAYVVQSPNGLWVFDVSTPASPVDVGFLETPGSASDVAVSSGCAYVADWASGLRVIDVSTPSAPVEIGSHEGSGEAQQVAISDGYVYVASTWGGMYVFRECSIFVDGFESGDCTAWSSEVP